jgi:hypothetical protein
MAQLDALLKSCTLEPAYHCTRLTSEEVSRIRRTGMQLSGVHMLANRIEQLIANREMSTDIGKVLLGKHQAAHPSRADQICFIFFPPHHAGESGIGLLFRHWGGEALYGEHVDDPVTSPILQSIGSPCVVVASIPVTSLRTPNYLSIQVVRCYLVNRNWSSCPDGDLQLQCSAVKNIAAGDVRSVVQFPDSEFLRLTGCESWRLKLVGDLVI